MKQNLLKILTSLPMILIMVYFIPLVGVCLIITRYFINGNKKHFLIPIVLIIVGIIILIPKTIELIIDIGGLNNNLIPCLNDIVNSKVYSINLIKYSKSLITIGIIFIIIDFILETIFNKIVISIRSYINGSIRRDAEISKQNDMEIKIKQQKLRNTNYVRCPNCGSDNIISEKTGTCQFCRRTIENKKYIG